MTKAEQEDREYVADYYDFDPDTYERSIAFLAECRAVARASWNWEAMVDDNGESLLSRFEKGMSATDAVMDLGDVLDLLPGGGGRRYGHD